MSNRIPMKGTTLAIGATLIEQITSADVILTVEVTMIDATELGSTSMQNVPGLPDFGTVEIKGHWDPSAPGIAALYAAAATSVATTVLNGTLTDSNAATIATTGPIKSFKVSGGGPNDLAKFECSQKVNSYVLTP